MSTGTLQQCYVNFPYPITGARPWLRDIGYCLWILEIVLFALFTALLLIRYIWRPVLFKKNVLEFPQSSYLGAIPISLNTIIIGIVSYYDYRSSARYAAFVVWCIALVLTMFVSLALLTVQSMRIPEQSISDVAGIWLMTIVPLFTTASSGATLLPYMAKESTKIAIIILVISYLCWAAGTALATFIFSVYLFRLLTNKLPGPQLLASTFLPLAVLGNGAYAAQQMSIFLASCIRSGFAPTQDQPPPLPSTTLDATAEVIHWMGLLISLAYLGHASFWFFQATAAMFYQLPKSFNISLWSLVFPLASYTNAWAVLSRDFRNDGMRGWAAFNTMLVTILWLFCAVMTTYLGFWKGSLFSAPGLDDWLGKGDDGKQRKNDESQQNGDVEQGMNGASTNDSTAQQSDEEARRRR